MKFIKNTCKIFFITALLLSLAFFGCSDLFKGSSSSIQFKIDIPHTREISSTHYKMTVELISMDGKFSSNQERTVYPNTSEIFKFDDILIGSNIKIKAKITAEEKELYTGETDWQEVKTGTNKISLTLEKVYQAPEAQEPEEKPPVEIKNAAKPIIVVQPISQTELVDPNSNSAPSFPTSISIGAIVSDEGTLSFQWQEKTGSNWEPLEGLDVTIDVSDIGVNTSTLPITLDLNTSRVFRCIVKNTNENVNGEKTAEIISDEVTVAYIEGTLSSISATYKSDSYELLGKDFNYSNVSVTETYTRSDNETTTITFTADNDRYTISPNTDSENPIGYVPYTVTYKDTTASLTVPVKYELDASNLVLETYFNSMHVSESDTDNAIKIPQYGTVKYKYDNDKLPSIFDKDGSNTEIKDINSFNSDEQYFKATISSNGTTIENEATCKDVGTYTYTVKLESANEWFVCNSNTSKDFSVEVCPWKISLTMNDGSTVDVSNLSEKTSYSLSINNEAIPSGFNYSPTLETESTSFSIQGYTLTTPAAIEDTQTAQIIAKCGDQQIASITVTVGAMVGSVNNPIIAWDDLINYLDISSEVPSTIYIQGSLSSNEKAVVNRPVTIVPKGNVTITRTSESDYIFEVNKNLELQGLETNKITLAGNADVENSQPLISCVSNVNVNLNYCTLENANCGSNSYGSVLYASNGSSINMNYCVVQNNKGVPISLCNTGENKIVNTSFLNNEFTSTGNKASCINVNNENANLVLDSCTFYNKTNSTYSGELSIDNAKTITIKNTTFETVDSGYNIYAYKAPEVVLDGSLSIPSIYFDNSYGDSSLGIVCGEDLTLKDPQIPIKITAGCYDEMNGSTEVDINLFSLEDGKTVPSGIFTLANANYTINSNTGNIESTNTSGGSSVTIYTDYAELKNAIAAISTGETETFYVSGDITSTSTTITVKGNITLLATEEGASIYRLPTFTSDSLFTIEKSASLVLGGTSSGQLVIDGSDVEVSYPLINSSGSLEIGEHCILQNNNNVTSTKEGGAIYEYCTSGDAPTLKISGGKIQNCNAKAGGAIYIQGGSNCEINFDFSGGEISNNYTTTGNGGAVYLKNTSGTLSGTIIKNNYAQLSTTGNTSGGGGIYVTNSTLNMTAGSIENNTTNSSGGGVFVNTSGIFNITGGDIKENATETSNSMNIFSFGTVTINETAGPTGGCNQNIINGVLTDEISSYGFTDFDEWNKIEN